MKKVFLTSAIAMCTVAPAMAVPSNSSNTFPDGGLMQEDYTYVNQANYTNMGIYTGNVAADANYENILYDVDAGQYLMHGTTTGTQCPSGSYCPGLDDVLYDGTNDQGLYACSSLEGNYTLSDAGSDANTDCYRNCTAADTGVQHAATATGTTNYGGTPSTDCTLATCDTGYTASNGACNANSYSITYGNMTGATNYENAPSTYTYGVGATISGVPTKAGYVFSGWCTDDQLTDCAMTQTIGTDAIETQTLYASWTECAACSGNTGATCTFAGVVSNQCTYTTTCNDGYYGLTNSGAYNASCSQCPSGYDHSDSNATTNAQCYRACDSANMGTSMTTIANASTFTGSDYYNSTSNDTCTLTGCVNGYHVDNGACAGNAITITWNGASQADIDANNAGSTVYGGNINTPRAATPIPGKRFTGWTFVKTPVAFDLTTLSSQISFSSNVGFISGSGNPGDGDGNPTPYGLTENGTWGVTSSDGSFKIRGETRCSTVEGTFYKAGDPGSEIGDRYCWCRVTGYQANGTSEWQDVRAGNSSAPWVYEEDTDGGCSVSYCSYNCGLAIAENSEFRQEIFGQSSN